MAVIGTRANALYVEVLRRLESLERVCLGAALVGGDPEAVFAAVAAIRAARDSLLDLGAWALDCEVGGGVVAVRLSDSRVVGPFPTAAAATAWLRTVPNGVFPDAEDAERARCNGDVLLARLEHPDRAGAIPRPAVELGPEWEGPWARLPPDACGYWQRARSREADDRGFGCDPASLMTPVAAEAMEERRVAEDERDPPCGGCSCCATGEGDGP